MAYNRELQDELHDEARACYEDSLREAFAALGIEKQMATIEALGAEALAWYVEEYEFTDTAEHLRWLRGEIDAEGRNPEADRFELLMEEMGREKLDALLFAEDYRKAREAEDAYYRSLQARADTQEEAPF